jgi:hypothetical protein
MKQLGLWGPPSPPTERTVTAALRGLNQLFSEPTAVSITGKGLVGASSECPKPHYGREIVPGNSQKFDAVASARRLIAALRDLESA